MPTSPSDAPAKHGDDRPVAHISFGDEKCGDCGGPVMEDDLFTYDADRLVCLTCAGLDRLIFLPSGNSDRLLGPEVVDVDGNTETRDDTVSVFNGPPPMIRVLKTEAEENQFVGEWIVDQVKKGVLPHEFGLFVRSSAQLDRAEAAVKSSMSMSRRPAVISLSARCICQRGSSSVLSS